MDVFSQLAAPFPPDRISWRVGSTTADKARGMALAYIDARDVMERLDAIMGPGGWQCRYPHANGKTVCEVGLKIDGEWIWKADGAGDTDFEAEKGALSDAFKRAAVRWGIGRYLYDIPSKWVQIEPAGKSFKIKDSEYTTLETLLQKNGSVLATDEAVADRLIAQINKTKSASDLFELKESEDFKQTWQHLSVGARLRVSNAGQARRDKFIQEKAA
jgi:hypothetical protein